MSGVIKSEVLWDEAEEKLHHQTTQPSEQIILERNQRLRKDDGAALRDLSFGRQVASIPFITWEWAIRNGFDLNSPDAEIAQKEMFRFLQTTDEGKACMVRERL